LTYGRQRGGAQTTFSEEQLFNKNFPASGPNGHSPFFCNNANAALNRLVWIANRFDETLTGLEDLHLAKRLVGLGHRVEYVANASVYHYHHESPRQVVRRFEREALALQTIMPEIHMGLGVALSYFGAAVLSDWSKALQQGNLVQKLFEIPKYRFCQYYGSWRGNHSHRKMSRESRERYFFPQ
jgi:rhamnosyltransferase